MTLKEIIKWFTPPVLIEAQRTIRGKSLLRFVWEGVYPSFPQVPLRADGHDSSAWLAHSRSQSAFFLDRWREKPILPDHVWMTHAQLPLLVAATAGGQRRLRILDFGGGIGVSYAALRSCLVDQLRVEYHIVEGQKSCEKGEELFRGVQDVYFHPTIPKGEFDLIYSCEALQYVEDFAGLLRQLADYRASHLFLASLPAGDVPRFASSQVNFVASSVRCWFFNLPEIVEILAEREYQLVYQSCTDRVYNMSNFPPTHRLPRHCNLLFRLAG